MVKEVLGLTTSGLTPFYLSQYHTLFAFFVTLLVTLYQGNCEFFVLLRPVPMVTLVGVNHDCSASHVHRQQW